MSSLKNTPPTSSCSICSAYSVGKRLGFDEWCPPASEVVHQICSECDAFELDESQLCDFCSHIRPNHLLTCRCVHDLFDNHGNGQFDIVLGTPTELYSRQKNCAFCQWCLEVVQADARLRQHTIDETRFVYILRQICIEKLYYGPAVDAHNGWHAETILYYESKASRFFRDAVNPQWVRLGHNKRLKVLPVNDSKTSTEPSLLDLKNFSVPPPAVDWAIVRRWKATCDRGHDDCRKGAIGKLPGGFRLIDVEMECITATSLETVSFFALSYVWGAHTENEIATRRDNLPVLMQSHSLRHLPRTVSDAMHVCKQMGQRYLWVDRLCIVQDDRQDKYGQIGSLEAIYSRADLVIVAACGDSIRSGLVGANEEFPREQQQFPLNTFGFTLANKLHDFTVATQSIWNERGWTYQEAVLSRRKLYFTPAEVWFECDKGHMRENPFSIGYRKDAGYLLRARDTGDARSTCDIYEHYRQHVEQYSARKLTYPSDIYHAFHGIENAFYPDGRAVYGLPESDFSRALLWYPYDWPALRERRCDNEDMIFPSWSWASLEGHIATCRLYGAQSSRLRQRGSFYYSLCEWDTWDEDHRQQGSRRINSVNDQNVWAELDVIWSDSRGDRKYPDHFDSFRGFPDYRQFLAMAWFKGCIEANIPTDLADQKSDYMSPQALESRWPTIRAFSAEVEKQRQKHYSADIHDYPRLNPGHLATRTQWSILSIEHNGIPEHLNGSIYIPNANFVIRSKSPREGSKAVGALLGTVEYRLRGAALSSGAADVDFIALAVGAMPECITRNVDGDTLEKNWFHVEQPREEIDFGQPGIIVMAVRWTGSIAHRLALGWVTLQGWVDSQPEFRTLVLA